MKWRVASCENAKSQTKFSQNKVAESLIKEREDLKLLKDDPKAAEMLTYLNKMLASLEFENFNN